MRVKVRTRVAFSSALALSLVVGGSRANADLVLTITDHDTSTSADHANITFDSTTGTVTSFNGDKNSTYDFLINGAAVEIKTNNTGGVSSSTPLSGISFTKNNVTATFVADNGGGASDGTTTFGKYTINNLSAMQNTNGSNSSSTINDITTDVGDAGSKDNSLTITPGFSFLNPSGPTLLLKSTLNPSNIDDGQVTFVSTIDSQSTAIQTATKNHLSPPATSTVVTLGAGQPPYLVNNSLVITGLTNGDIDNISATTRVVNAVPEPATLVALASALPLAGFGTWFRRRKILA